jgi:hypothetical protein
VDGRRTDPWRCRACGRPADLAPHALEVGLVRLAVAGPDGFRLGSAGVEPVVADTLAPCPCGGRLEAGTGAGDPLAPGFDAEALRPLAQRGWRVLEASGEPALGRLRALWRPRALALLGRDDEVSRDERLRLRLEERLAGLAGEMEAARARGDDDAAEAAHARYIELGTTYVRRFVLAEGGGPGGADGS